VKTHRHKLLLALIVGTCFAVSAQSNSGPASKGKNPEYGYHDLGSTYVPLDSWVYPALERMAAKGFVRTAFLGLKPWTRAAIAQMLNAGTAMPTNANAEDLTMMEALRVEFTVERNADAGVPNASIQLESIYSRTTVIAGKPLADSYHFGQTLINDFGRPYQEGFNQISGFSSRAESGPFAFYVRGEYQHAPGADAYPLDVRQAIARADGNPVQPATPLAPVDAFRFLDAYASTTLFGNDFSFGKQSLWWGPGTGGAMIMSDNAAPFYMARLNRVLPLNLPGILRYLGPLRYDAFFGRLEGHSFPPRPFMHGEKFSFKPTENFEFGFSRTAVFAGQGLTPLTFDTLLHTYFSTTSGTGPGLNLRNNPGARFGGFDFSYRIPGLRNWLTLYSDSVAHDDVSPISAPRRAAINPGLYLSHFPGLDKLDLRLEGVNTDPPTSRSNNGRFIYYEGFYRDAYTNDHNLMGSWIGREGKGVQVWSTYWLSAMSTVQVNYRNAKVEDDFIPGGETANDFGLNARLRIRPNLELQGGLQYEEWKAPILFPVRESNVTASFQLTFWPRQLTARKVRSTANASAGESSSRP